MTIRTLIVDDENLARRGLRSLLRRADDVEIVAECQSGREAIEFIVRSGPDLVFLDIQMPGKTGFEVISEIGLSTRPYVIFVTAFDKFALQAFDVHALDYLLKPINEDRFYEALSRARAALLSMRDDTLIRQVAQAVASAPQGQVGHITVAGVDRLPVKANGKIIPMRVADIDWIEADDDYVVLHAGDKSWILRESISNLEPRLASCGFVRIHRSAMVNVDRVCELRPRLKGECSVILIDGTQLKLTRTYRAAIERLVGPEF
jgi:two-component system, LytTR family, response regulator